MENRFNRRKPFAQLSTRQKFNRKKEIQEKWIDFQRKYLISSGLRVKESCFTIVENSDNNDDHEESDYMNNIKFQIGNIQHIN